MHLSPEREKLLCNRVARDLEPKVRIVWLKSAVAIAVGGGVSLLVCAQFGVGQTQLAESYNAWLHSTFGGFWCMVACALHFAVLPAFVLRLLCNGLQFRAIHKRYAYIPLSLLATAGALLSQFGGYAHGFLELMTWTLSAVGTFQLTKWALLSPWLRASQSA